VKPRISKEKILILILFPSFFTLIIYILFTYSLGNPNLNSIPLLPEQAYVIALHEVYNRPLSDINNITFIDVKGKFTYQYVMIKNDGTVYLLNKNNNSVITTIGNTIPPITDGTHFAWEININNTKIYVDSTSGQIVSIANKKS
jgi:hypothetical protein